LWNVADALARYHCSAAVPTADGAVVAGEGASASSSGSPTHQAATGAQFEDLWVEIFMHLRVLAVDERPEVRNCAVKSLTSACFLMAARWVLRAIDAVYKIY